MEEIKKHILLICVANYNEKVNDISKFKLNNKEIDMFCEAMQIYAEKYHAKQLAIQNVSNSYSVVRWHDNEYEDVVCVNKDIALEYIQKYNKLAGKELCYLDEDIWLPLSKA